MEDWCKQTFGMSTFFSAALVSNYRLVLYVTVHVCESLLSCMALSRCSTYVDGDFTVFTCDARLRLRKRVNVVQLFPQTQAVHTLSLFLFKYVKPVNFTPVITARQNVARLCNSRGRALGKHSSIYSCFENGCR